MRTDRLLLGDILEAIEEVVSTTPDSWDAFDRDKLVRSHVLRNIQIIGEAVSRLSDEIQSRNPSVPWRAIAGMRHAIVHDYFEIDWNEVFRTASNDVPGLKPLVESIVEGL